MGEEFPLLHNYRTDDLLFPFFVEKFNTSNFFYVWGFMDGYLDVEKFSELGKFFIKSKRKSDILVDDLKI